MTDNSLSNLNAYGYFITPPLCPPKIVEAMCAVIAAPSTSNAAPICFRLRSIRPRLRKQEFFAPLPDTRVTPAQVGVHGQGFALAAP